MRGIMKVWTKEEIQDLLQTNDATLERGLMRIYDFQTRTEQLVGHTRDHNGVGFNGVDGELLSSFAEFMIKRTSLPFGQRLSTKQKMWARKKMKKYAGQLVKVANGDMGVLPVLR